MTTGGVDVECDILAFLIESCARGASQPLGQGRLAFKLVRKLPRRKHGFGVRSGCLAESGIERQTGRSGLRSGLIRQLEKYVFRIGIVVAERNIRSSCRGWL